jgi:hypothetical protein
MAKSKRNTPIVDDTIHEPLVEDLAPELGDNIAGEPKEFSVAVRSLIDTQVAQLDPFLQRANELIAKYSAYGIKDVDDKEGYEQVRVAIGELRTIRTGTKADKISLKAPLKAAMDEIESKAKFIISTVSPLEESLQARKDEIDAIREEIKLKRKQAEESRNFERISQLVRLGATSVDGRLVLEDASFDLHLIREADDDIFQEDILSRFQKIYDRKQEDVLKEQEQKRLEQEELKRQQDELLEQQRKFKEEQETFAKQKAEQDERERKDREKKEAEQKEIVRKRTLERVNKLTAVGMAFSFQDDTYVFRSVSVPVASLHEMTDEDFTVVVTNAESRIADIKAEEARLAEEKRIADQKVADEKKAQEIKEAADLAVKQAEEKRLKDLEDQRVKDVAEAAAKAKALLEASDKEKWAYFLTSISSLVVPSMQSGQYAGKGKNARLLIDQIKKL